MCSNNRQQHSKIIDCQYVIYRLMFNNWKMTPGLQQSLHPRLSHGCMTLSWYGFTSSTSLMLYCLLRCWIMLTRSRMQSLSWVPQCRSTELFSRCASGMSLCHLWCSFPQRQSFGVPSKYVQTKQEYVSHSSCASIKCFILLHILKAQSPRAGQAVDWETLAKRELKKSESNRSTLEWLQSQWLEPDVKEKLDMYEKCLEKACPL